MEGSNSGWNTLRGTRPAPMMVLSPTKFRNGFQVQSKFSSSASQVEAMTLNISQRYGARKDVTQEVTYCKKWLTDDSIIFLERRNADDEKLL